MTTKISRAYVTSQAFRKQYIFPVERKQLLYHLSIKNGPYNMVPIPIHADKPINPEAAKADGVTPRTALDGSLDRYAPRPTTTTATPSRTSHAYPAAQPGAPAVPAPTGSINKSFAPRQQPQPTPTRTTALLEEQGPPAPQPGAVPVPTAYSTTSITVSTLPPPPQSGQTASRPSITSATHMPPQFSMAPPPTAYMPTHSTTTTAPSSTGPHPISLPQHHHPSTTTFSIQPLTSQTPDTSLEHPPGYQQNPYADALTPAQRTSQDIHDKSEQGASASVLSGLAPGALLPGRGGDGAGHEDGEGAWGTAKRWVGEVVGKVGEMEGEVWKKVNSQR